MIKLNQLLIFSITIPLLLSGQTERWVYRYNGPGNIEDVGHDLICGPAGNIYATGRSADTDSFCECTVISLDSLGNERWIYRYDLPGDYSDDAFSLIFDTLNNIYVAGTTGDTIAGFRFTVISLDTSGGERWVYRHDGAEHGLDVAFAITCGSDGNLYATGQVRDSAAIISLTPSGGERWVYQYPWDQASKCQAIVYGTDNNLYAAGDRIASAGTHNDFLVLSVDNAGNERWTYAYDGDGYLDEAFAVTYGGDANIYAAGYSQHQNTVGYDFTVISLTAAGSERWVYSFDSTSMDEATAVAFATDNNIYTAGTNGDDFVALSLAPDGNERWIYTYDGPGHDFDCAYSLIPGVDDYLYAGGYSAQDDSNTIITIACLDSLSNERWIYKYDGPGSGTDNIPALVYGSDGNLYAAGYSEGINSDKDFTILSLSPEVGVEEVLSKGIRRKDYCCTIINGPLQLPEKINYKIFDITGREIKPERLRPGIYFIEVEGRIAQKIIKIR